MFAKSGTIWIKFRRLVHNDMSTAVMWSKSKPDVKFQYGERLGEFNGMLSRSTMQGAATWRIHCHDSRATCHIAGCSHLAKSMWWSCHIAGCKNYIRHIKNPFSTLFYFVFNTVSAVKSGGFCIISDTLANTAINTSLHRKTACSVTMVMLMMWEIDYCEF